MTETPEQQDQGPQIEVSTMLRVYKDELADLHRRLAEQTALAQTLLAERQALRAENADLRAKAKRDARSEAAEGAAERAVDAVASGDAPDASKGRQNGRSKASATTRR